MEQISSWDSIQAIGEALLAKVKRELKNFTPVPPKIPYQHPFLSPIQKDE